MTKPPIPFLPPCERCGAAAGEPSHASTTWDVCPVCLRTNRNTPPIDDTPDPIALLMAQVHAGGKLSIVGYGPLSAPGPRGYDATLTSHTGARHAAAHGDSLGECLKRLVIRWESQ